MDMKQRQPLNDHILNRINCTQPTLKGIAVSFFIHFSIIIKPNVVLILTDEHYGNNLRTIPM